MHYMLIARSERTRHEYSSSGHVSTGIFSIPLACFTSKTRQPLVSAQANQFDKSRELSNNTNLALFIERCQNSIRTYFHTNTGTGHDNCRMQMTEIASVNPIKCGRQTKNQ